MPEQDEQKELGPQPPAPEPVPEPEPLPAAEPAGHPPRPSLRTRLWVLLMAGVLVPAAFALAGILLAWLLRDEWLPAGLTGPRDWPPVLLWAALGMAASIGSTTGLSAIWPRFGAALERSGLRAGEDVLRVAGVPIMAVVVALAGLGEEILFRGGLQPSIGLFPAAVAFGLAHGGWNPRELWAYVLAALISGLAFGAIYDFSGQLWAPILAHAGHNLLVTLYLIYRRRARRLDS